MRTLSSKLALSALFASALAVACNASDSGGEASTLAGGGSTGLSGKGGSATAGSGTAGSGVSGSGTAGSGTAGSATAGSGTAGTGTPAGGSGGSDPAGGKAGSGTAGSTSTGGKAGSGTAGSTSTGGKAGSGTAGTGTAGTGTAGTGTAGSGTAGSGGASMCTGLLQAGACATCLEAQCCGEGGAGDADSICLGDCLGQMPPMACNTNAPLMALDACLQKSCPSQCGVFTPVCDAPATAPSGGACGASFTCNPVTNTGCMGGGVCDVGMGGFECYADGNVKNLCEECGTSDTDFCTAGLSCNNGKCGRYCCDDGDCGTGKCDKTIIMGNGMGMVGLCAAP